jgi:hypothetical protein
MFIIDNAAICAGRNHLTRAEVGLVFNREPREFLELLRCEELVEHDALRRQHGRSLDDGRAGF